MMFTEKAQVEAMGGGWVNGIRIGQVGEYQRPEFALPGLAYGQLGIIAGEPGAGKTMLSIALALRSALGGGRSMLIAGQDGEDSLSNRLAAFRKVWMLSEDMLGRASEGAVFFPLGGKSLDLLSGARGVVRGIGWEGKPGLVILDGIPEIEGANRQTAMTLARGAAESGCAVLITISQAVHVLSQQAGYLASLRKGQAALDGKAVETLTVKAVKTRSCPLPKDEVWISESGVPVPASRGGRGERR